VNWCTLAGNGQQLVFQRHRGRVLMLAPGRHSPETAQTQVTRSGTAGKSCSDSCEESADQEPQGISLALLYGSGNWCTATA
jgi:hypothetical protein